MVGRDGEPCEHDVGPRVDPEFVQHVLANALDELGYVCANLTQPDACWIEARKLYNWLIDRGIFVTPIGGHVRRRDE